MEREISQNGIKFLKELEGSRNGMYLDSSGLPTIGVGHLLTKDELTSGKIYIDYKRVKYRDGLSDGQIMLLLSDDLCRYEHAVHIFVDVYLKQNQYDALVCFAFNVGTTAFANSTLRKELNKGNYHEVPTQMARWNRSGGKVIQGLINRRKKEIELWNREVSNEN